MHSVLKVKVHAYKEVGTFVNCCLSTKENTLSRWNTFAGGRGNISGGGGWRRCGGGHNYFNFNIFLIRATKQTKNTFLDSFLLYKGNINFVGIAVLKIKFCRVFNSSECVDVGAVSSTTALCTEV